MKPFFMKMTEMMMIHYQRNHLIEKDANIDEKDEYQLTTLHYACGSGNLPIVQFLIEKGANIEAKQKD